MKKRDDEVTVPAERKLSPIRSPRVKVVAGADAGASVEAPGDRLTIGSAPGNDLVLHDETVSRYHLELEPLPDRIRVRDLGSTNGTRLGGVWITEAAVPAGTRLELGGSTIMIEDGPAHAPQLYPSDRIGSMLGRSASMRSLMANMERIAKSNASVLIVGETGTGKEVTARTVHELSARRDAPFETVDCGTLVPTLIASELFGHERGAFTGATEQHVGAFERAHGGTLFLDEIGELPPPLQVSLLGAIERRAFKRVGGAASIKVDVRLICATHRDLRAEVNANRFRADLYYRIAVVMLRVPALRERLDDLPLLVDGFLREMGVDQPVESVVPTSAWETMRSHTWPGNVRELRNFIEATFVTGSPPEVGAGAVGAGGGDAFLTVPFEQLVNTAYKDARARVIEDFETAYIKRLLERTDGNVSKAALIAKMNRSYFSQVVRRLKKSE